MSQHRFNYHAWHNDLEYLQNQRLKTEFLLSGMFADIFDTALSPSICCLPTLVTPNQILSEWEAFSIIITQMTPQLDN